MPLLSVIMSVYEEPLAWIEEAIESIRQQTFKEFEFIIINDQPKRTELLNFLNRYANEESRIIILNNEKNLGLAESLNRGLEIAKGKYIARMDSDDLAFPERLEQQYQYMEAHQDIDLSGTQVIKVNTEKVKIGVSNNVTSFEVIKSVAPYINVLTHPTWIFKKELIHRIGNYRNLPGEDYDFVLRVLTDGGKIANLDIPLLYYRVNAGSYTHTISLQQKAGFKIVQEMYRQRKERGKDNFNQETITIKINQLLGVYENGQQRAMQYLTQSKDQRQKGNFLFFLYYLLLSAHSSPIQRSYYKDWLKAAVIRFFMERKI